MQVCNNDGPVETADQLAYNAAALSRVLRRPQGGGLCAFYGATGETRHFILSEDEGVSSSFLGFLRLGLEQGGTLLFLHHPAFWVVTSTAAPVRTKTHFLYGLYLVAGAYFPISETVLQRQINGSAIEEQLERSGARLKFGNFRLEEGELPIADPGALQRFGFYPLEKD